MLGGGARLLLLGLKTACQRVEQTASGRSLPKTARPRRRVTADADCLADRTERAIVLARSRRTDLSAR
jgi:hypothetical protein